MKAVRIHGHGGTEMLQFEDIPEPACDKNKIKINIRASAINHLDIWVRRGMPGVDVPLPLILGSDGAGTIVETGKEITGWDPGDEVVILPGTSCKMCAHCKTGNENYCQDYGIMGETQNGIQAEYIIVEPVNIFAKPAHLTFEEAASMPLVFMTAYQMLIKRANLQMNERVLIYGGTSGVGSAAIQISRCIGAYVIATVGTSDKVKYAESMGADKVLVHNNENWWDEISEITERRGVDVVFEHVGKKTWMHSLHMLARGGRIVTCGATTGMDVNINLAHLFTKQHSILGSTMSSFPISKEVMKNIHNHIYFPFVDKIFKIQNIRKAHDYIENRLHKGKVLLKFDS